MSRDGTEFTFTQGGEGAVSADVLLVPLMAKPQPPLELLSRVDKFCDDAVSQLVAAKALPDEVGQLAHTARGGNCRRVLAISLGDVEKLTAADVRNAAANAARWMQGEGLASAALWVDGLATSSVDGAVAEWALGMAVAGYRFDRYKEPDKKTPDKIKIELRGGESGYVASILTRVKDALTLATAVNYTRRLGHEPANELHPAAMAREARALARNSAIRCTVHTAEKLKQMKMGGLLAVGAAAEHPPCLIQLEYRGAPGTRARTVLVGKAITFDTGGYSIKPSAGLEEMKFDKCGGCTVMGIMKAAADLKLKCNLFGLVATAENAISERAYRPGDILRMASGKTVQVISTDAEGRLVLADALWYAQQKLKPTALIDMATLTGGVTIALGSAAAGVMSNDDSLAADLGEAGRRTQERLWRLPLWDEYRELIKSTEADIRNSATKRAAHCIVGGMFLKEFINQDVPWAHLDIAAVATGDNGKGATGFGVRLLIEYLRQRGA
jgi:leucyl aminopeptidase